MVFYFTGTGNSLYIAQQLELDPVSIPQVMARRELAFEAEAIGVVAPVYGHEAPPMVKEFLHKAAFRTGYFYMVLTYGNRHGGAAELAAGLCRQCGIQPAYINVIQMVDNWLPAFDMEEQKQLDKQIDSQLAAIQGDIRARRRWIAPASAQDRAAHQEFLNRMSQLPPDAWQHLLRVTEDSAWAAASASGSAPPAPSGWKTAGRCTRRAAARPAWPASMPAPTGPSS